MDRAKSGTKRSVLSDGRGAPLAVVVAGANAPDQPLALKTLDSIPVERPARVVNLFLHSQTTYKIGSSWLMITRTLFVDPPLRSKFT